jgi:hypothetical protein
MKKLKYLEPRRGNRKPIEESLSKPSKKGRKS